VHCGVKGEDEWDRAGKVKWSEESNCRNEEEGEELRWKEELNGRWEGREGVKCAIDVD
jgi:hypothetical protein